MAQGESHHIPGPESPLKTLFLNSSKGEKEEFMLWLVDRYPEFICLLLRTSIYAENVKCRGDENG
jgi:hypothetical protein